MTTDKQDTWLHKHILYRQTGMRFFSLQKRNNHLTGVLYIKLVLVATRSTLQYLTVAISTTALLGMHMKKTLHPLAEPTVFRFICFFFFWCFGKTINEELIEQQQNTYQDNPTTHFSLIVSSLKRTLPLSQMVRVMHLGKSTNLALFLISLLSNCSV